MDNQTDIQPVDQGATADNGGQLPSTVEANDGITEKFSLTEEFVEGNFKDGKLYGRFDSLEGVLNTLKDVETKYANQTRELKNGQKESDTQAQEASKQEEVQRVQTQTVQELVPEFLQNGMELTPEMEAKAAEAGLDIRDVKLGAIEMRDKITTAHSVVGGEEQYRAMLDWAGDKLSDAEMKAFDKDVMSVNSKYAIKGLYTEYQEAVNDGSAQAGRYRGDTNGQTGASPYSNLNELLRDKNYLESRQGRADKAAQKQYQARLNITDDSVIYGR